MRAELGPVLANLLIVAAGIAVLFGLGMVELSVAGVLGALGLGFLTGAAVVGLLILALLLVGVGFSVGTVIVVALAVAVGGCVASQRRRGTTPAPSRRGLSAPGSPRQWLGAVRTLSVEQRLVALWSLIFGVYAVIGLARAGVKPLVENDGWALWTRKALLLTDFQHVPTAFFRDHAYVITHQNYPLLLPALEAIWFRFAGRVDTQAVHVELWLLLVAFIWAAAFIVARRGGRVVAWGPLLFLIVLAPQTSSQLLAASADVPMALFAGLGVLLLGLWITDGRAADLWLATLFLAATANTKNEGLAVAVIALAVAGIVVVSRCRREIRHFALAAAGLVVAVLPWHVWTAIHGIPGDPDVPIGKGFDLPYLFGRASRIWPSVGALHKQLSDTGAWSYVVPIGIGAALACLIWRVARRAALFYLATGALIFCVYLWVYWLSPLDLNYYLVTTPYRIVDVLVFIALVAALQLVTEADRRISSSASVNL